MGYKAVELLSIGILQASTLKSRGRSKHIMYRKKDAQTFAQEINDMMMMMMMMMMMINQR